MIFGTHQSICGIVATNSPSYLKEIFLRMNAGDVVVTLRSEGDDERKDLAGVQDVVVPSHESGWLHSVTFDKSYEKNIAQVQFTSGTEGDQKAILISHAALAHTTDRLISAMEMNGEIREYLGIPAYYSFGFARCRAVSEVGGSIFIPPNGFDLVEIADMLKHGEINALSAVPTLWRLVLQNADLFTASGDLMRWIEIGSQYMSGAEKAQLKAIFPRAKIIQHYGLTEASRTTLLKVHEVQGHLLESVGKPCDGVAVSIDGDGRIKTSGNHIASGKIKDGQILPLVDEHGWLTTNDIGHLDDGFLYYDGRADDSINCSGIKLSPEATEQAICSKLNIASGLHAAKVDDELRGDAVLIAYAPELDLDAIKVATETVLKEFGVQAGGSIHYMACANFPVTETGKVRRKAITELYENQVDPDGSTTADPDQTTEELQDPEMQAFVKIWEEALGISPVGIHDSFFDLGGDSLSAISVAMKLHKLGIPKNISREIFEGKSISELVNQSRSEAGRTPLANGNMTVDVVRGFLVLCVIAAHWMPGVVERLPEYVQFYNRFLSAFYSAGTPGFAIIFGVGIGFAYLPRYLRSPASVTPLAIRNAFLLAGGVFSIGILRIWSTYAGGQEMAPVEISNAFYGVLTYYFLGVLSIPIWLKFLSRRKNLWISCMGIAIAMYFIHLIVDANNPTPSSNPFLQTGILLTTAGYNYFELTAGVMFGLTFGVWFRQLIVNRESLNILWMTGCLLVAFSVAVSHEMDQMNYWLVWPKSILLWTWFFYAGALLIALWFVFRTAEKGETQAWSDQILKVLAIVGILAFPLFIGHEMVIPFKDLLEAYNLPGSLVISMATFLGISGYLGVRLHRIYYPAESAVEPANSIDSTELIPKPSTKFEET